MAGWSEERGRGKEGEGEGGVGKGEEMCERFRERSSEALNHRKRSPHACQGARGGERKRERSEAVAMETNRKHSGDCYTGTGRCVHTRTQTQTHTHTQRESVFLPLSRTSKKDRLETLMRPCDRLAQPKWYLFN